MLPKSIPLLPVVLKELEESDETLSAFLTLSDTMSCHKMRTSRQPKKLFQTTKNQSVILE